MPDKDRLYHAAAVQYFEGKKIAMLQWQLTQYRRMNPHPHPPARLARPALTVAAVSIPLIVTPFIAHSFLSLT